MSRISWILLKALVLIAFAGASAGVSAQSRATDRANTSQLTGVWTLNKKLSDDPAKVMEAKQSAGHAGGAGHTRPGSSGGHGAAGHGGGASRGGMNPEHTRLLEAPGRLTITQTAGSITFTDGNGQSQTLTTDDKKQKRPLGNRTVEVKAKWDDSRQLHVMVKLEGSHLARPVDLRRVYDAESRR